MKTNNSAFKYYFFILFILPAILASGQVKLKKLTSPVLFRGDSITAYRAPAVYYHKKIFYLFFALSEVENDGRVFTYVATTQSNDLIHWTPVRKITPRDQNLDYSSPGNVIKYKNEWILCLQTYPRPGLKITDGMRTAGPSARLFIMRSPDLENWGEPELLRVKGRDVPDDKMGRMIDPYLVEDKDEKGKYWCFYKQNGVSMSYTRDFVNWTFFGNTESGENVCVLTENNQYMLFHSPANGIGIKKSSDLVHWETFGGTITLGQADWEWAKGRLGGPAVINLKKVSGFRNYLMFFYALGPLTEAQGYFDRNVSVGIAWSSNLTDWEWPGK